MSSGGTLDITLPSKQTIEGARMAQLKWLLYGSPGIGKSTFFSKAHDGNRKPLFLYTDPGLRFIKAFKKPVMSWKQFEGIVKGLMADPASTKQYSIIVLDTVDLLFRMCRAEICLKRGLEHISDAEWGKGYDLVRDAFEQVIAKLCRLGDDRGFGVGFISHSKDVEIRGRTVRTSKLVPTLPKQAHDIVAPLCDVIGYAGFSVDKADKSVDGEMGRMVHFSPDETIEAKDRTGMLPAKCRLDFDLVRQALEGKAVDDEEEIEE